MTELCPMGVKRNIAAQHAICSTCSCFTLAASWPDKCNWTGWRQDMFEDMQPKTNEGVDKPRGKVNGGRKMTSMLKPFPFYYEMLPSFQSVITSFNEREIANIENFEDRWINVCVRNNIFQIWNKEYIEALSKEILNLVGENLVLEIAAGDGMLSHWLREYGVNIKATDNMSWHNKKPNNRTPLIELHSDVEELDAISAIRKYKPRMVIVSWIVNGSELDCEILDERPEYFILIGEGSFGVTGSIKFWGESMPAYWTQKGYSEKKLDVDTWNICRTDYPSNHRGSTVLYLEETERRVDILDKKVNGDSLYRDRPKGDIN